MSPGSLLVLVLSGCGGSPSDAVTWRESWEMVILTDQNRLIDARVTVGNTGVLKGQGHVQVDRWAPGEAPIQYGRTTAPSQTVRAPTGTAVTADADNLTYGNGRWTLSVRSDDASAVLHLGEDRGPEVAPSAVALDGGQWSTEAAITLGRAEGWIEAGKRGGKVSGRGVFLRRGGDGIPDGPRHAAFVLGPRVGIGVDRQGENLVAWATLDGVALDASDARITVEPDGAVQLDFTPAVDLVATLQPTRVNGTTDPHQHLTAPERALAGALVPMPLRQVTAAQAMVEYKGLVRRSPGLMVFVTEEPLALPADRSGTPKARKGSGEAARREAPGTGP